jgi:hypothetical protein
MTIERSGSGPSDRSGIVACAATALLIPVSFGVFGLPGWQPFLAGAAGWLIAVWLKVTLAVLLRQVTDLTPRPVLAATVYGLFSVVTELGVAGWAFVKLLPALHPTEVIMFGAGAHCIEVLLCVSASLVQRAATPNSERAFRWQSAARQSWVVRYAALVERVVALFVHVGTRALVYAAVREGAVALIFPAALGFWLVDGVAAYGHLASWDWFKAEIMIRYYGFALVVGVMNSSIYLAHVAML